VCEVRTLISKLTRKDVIAFVLEGDWTPKRAEAWANQQGLAPFEGPPSSADFAPEHEEYWTLLMALTWIVYREMSKVREVWPRFIKTCKYWSEDRDPNGKQFWRLSPGGCNFDFYDFPNYIVEPLKAVNDFRRKLESGALAASGVSAGKRRKIETREWVDLQFIEIDSARTNMDCDLYSSTDTLGFALFPTFSKVLVSAKDVLAAYPAADDIRASAGLSLRPTADSPRRKRASPTKLEAAAEALKRIFPTGRPTLNRGELIQELRDKAPAIGSVSDRTMTRAIALAWPTAKPNRAN
jgi:hypothetical protein